MSEGMSFFKALEYAWNHRDRQVFRDESRDDCILHFDEHGNPRMKGGSHFSFTPQDFDTTWHVVETEADRLKREHAALVAMAKSIAGKKPWSTDGIEPRSVLIARVTLTELGLD